MPGNANQKMKLLYLMKILTEETDELHPLTIRELVAKLDGYNIQAERKSLYTDLEHLRMFGFDIEKTGSRACAYFVASRTFELPELKLLVDAVQSSQFITRKKSTELIRKIGSLSSVHEAQQLQRQVYIANRVKTPNESIYYNIDAIHTAIAQNRQITFRYFEWVVDFSEPEKVRRQFRKEGELYCVTPCALIWAEEKYYLVAFEMELGEIRHYRVDKMAGIIMLDKQGAEKERIGLQDVALYSQKMFGMYGGQEVRVKLKIWQRLIGVMLDKFGVGISISKCDDEHVYVKVNAAVSPPFIGWLLGFGDQIAVIEPPELVAELRQTLQQAQQMYDA